MGGLDLPLWRLGGLDLPLWGLGGREGQGEKDSQKKEVTMTSLKLITVFALKQKLQKPCIHAWFASS